MGYPGKYVMGARIKIAPLERLEAFRRDGRRPPLLEDSQLAFADADDTVASFSLNGGNIVYGLKHSPGKWHEELLSPIGHYSPLPHHIEKALNAIEPSWDGTLAYYPCRIITRDAIVFDTIYIEPEQPWVRNWGFYPDQSTEIRIEDIAQVAESPMRLPAHFATELYRHGESGMGYTIFTVVFADGQRQACGGGIAVDFIQYPDGKGPDDVVRVIPHEGRQDSNIMTRPRWYVCLYSARILAGESSQNTD